MLNRLLAASAVLILAGCSQERPADPNGVRKSEAPPERRHVVLIPPIDAGRLASIYPEAAVDLAGGIADRIDGKGASASADGRFGETLPNVADEKWSAGIPAEARGTAYVLLVRVTDLAESPGDLVAGGRQTNTTAVVDLELRGADGSVKSRVAGQYTETRPDQAKLTHPGMKQAARATRTAIDRAIDRLLAQMTAMQDAQTTPAPATTAVAAADGRIAITVDSEPGGADVLLDGELAGTTPMTLQLKPEQRVRLRIEQAGRLAWEREFTPQPGMKLKPSLPAK